MSTEFNPPTSNSVAPRTSLLTTIPVNISAGVVTGILVVFLEISLAALIFSGDLTPYFGPGIGILLLGAALTVFLATCFSGFNIAVNIPQDVPAAIIAIMAASIVSNKTGPASFETFATVVTVMGLSTLLTGVLLWWFGHYNLGRLVRFLPYPVIGGFMAGTGWLLFTGGVGVLNDGGINSGLLSSDTSAQWIPALILAVIMLLATRLLRQPLIMPIIVTAAVLLFFTAMAVLHGSYTEGLNEAMRRGWLLGKLPEAELWRPVTIDALQHADWTIVFSNSVAMLTIFLISTVSLLLNCSGLEISTKKDIDLNRELKSIGVSNMLSGVVGSSASYHMLSLSTLNLRLGATSRLSGLIIVLIIVATLIFGAGILANTPRLVLAAFLIYLGLSFLTEWLYDGYNKLPKVDYMLVWLILISIAAVGLLQGVVTGVLVAAVLFVIAYTSTDVVRHTFSRDKYQGHIMRPPVLEKKLEEHGSGFFVMELQGFIFFGMAHQLLDHVKNRLSQDSAVPLRYVLLDFRLVTGLDSSASYSFSRLRQITHQAGITLAFSNVNPDIQTYLGKKSDHAEEALIFDDLDQAVAWFDHRDIDSQRQQNEDLEPVPLLTYFQNALSLEHLDRGSVHERLLRHMQQQQKSTGTVLLHEGDPVSNVYFIESGEVQVQTTGSRQSPRILRVQSAGTVFGEIGIYNQSTATATVVVSRNAELYSLSGEALKKLDREDPELSIAIHRLIASTLGRKLTQANYALVALQK